jgi:hypothetical protein
MELLEKLKNDLKKAKTNSTIKPVQLKSIVEKLTKDILKEENRIKAKSKPKVTNKSIATVKPKSEPKRLSKDYYDADDLVKKVVARKNTVKPKKTEDSGGFWGVSKAKDSKIKAKPVGKRESEKVSTIFMKDGSSYERRNANQFGKAKGGKEYSENRPNRSDKKRFL